VPGGSPAQNTRDPITGGATHETRGVAIAKAVDIALGAGGSVLRKALNTSSRHGPHSSVPVAPIASSDVRVGTTMQAQKPGSSFSVPS